MAGRPRAGQLGGSGARGCASCATRFTAIDERRDASRRSYRPRSAGTESRDWFWWLVIRAHSDDPGIRYQDRQAWAAARDLADADRLTALWLEGAIWSRPAYAPNFGPDPETEPLIATLAAANRAGYLHDLLAAWMCA